MSYTYTIYDGDPNVSGPCSWPDHEDVELDCADTEEALEEVRSILEIEAAGLSPEDGYSAGDTIYANVWDEDGTLLGTVNHTLTDEDLGTGSPSPRVGRGSDVRIEAT